MCPVLNGCEDAVVWRWRVQVKFLSVGLDKSEVYKEKANTGDELVARIMNSSALVKQERQDDLRRVTPTITKRVENALK